MPVVPDTTGAYSALSMPLTGISFSAGGLSFSFTSATFVSPAVIDSGTTLMYLPDDIVLALYKSLGVQVASQVATLPCTSGKDQSAKMTFVFNGPNGAKIDIRLADLLLQMNDKNGKVSDTCEFLVSGGAPDGLILLGDSFMRSAYLVYDLQNNKIAIAQAKYNESTTNIKEINSDGIPSASVMSTLVSGASFAPAASSSLLGGNPTRSATGTGSGGVETTAPIPSFTLTPGRNAAPLSAAQVPVMSIVGVVVGTLTVLSVFGGAMVVWF